MTPARDQRDQLVKHFIDITKNDTIMNNWVARARLGPQFVAIVCTNMVQMGLTFRGRTSPH